MADARGTLTNWRSVAALLDQGWRIDGPATIVSPTGERRDAWLVAVSGCIKRGYTPAQPSTSKAEST